MQKLIRIGTRESQLAVWQATQVRELMKEGGYTTELVFIQSDGDIDLKTPLYEIGVQGVFTRSLDSALLSNKIDIAVHSLKDVPTQLADGIIQASVLPRANPRDLLVYKGDWTLVREQLSLSHSSLVANPGVAIEKSPALSSGSRLPFCIATSSIRRKAQWLHRYPSHRIENLRGNVNTRLRKVDENDWNGAIFAAAGLERINLRPVNSVELDWMLPAPGQGAIMVVCRQDDNFCYEACQHFNNTQTALCTKIERDFLRTLMGGCSTPIGALAEIESDELYFRGNILLPDGSRKASIEKVLPVDQSLQAGKTAAEELLLTEGRDILDNLHHARQ